MKVPNKPFPFNQIEGPYVGDRVNVWFKGDEKPRPIFVNAINIKAISKLSYQPHAAGIGAFIATTDQDNFDILVRKHW